MVGVGAGAKGGKIISGREAKDERKRNLPDGDALLPVGVAVALPLLALALALCILDADRHALLLVLPPLPEGSALGLALDRLLEHPVAHHLTLVVLLLRFVEFLLEAVDGDLRLVALERRIRRRLLGGRLLPRWGWSLTHCIRGVGKPEGALA